VRCWILPVGHFHTREDVLDPTAPGLTWVDIPVYAYLVDTGSSLVLFDTGCSPALRQDPAAILGEDARVLVPRLSPADDIRAALGRVGVQPSDVDVVALSHLHFDHAGGNQAFPAAEFWIQEAEWRAASAPEARSHYPDPAWRPASSRLRLIHGDVEIRPGLRLLATPGHTPGHQSLAVEAGPYALLFTSDAVYRASLFDPEHVGAAVDRDAAQRSVRRLRELAAAGFTPFFSHDPEQWREPWVRLAPAGYP
jgi:N-acyl homoserine lactone hydrolase